MEVENGVKSRGSMVPYNLPPHNPYHLLPGRLPHPRSLSHRRWHTRRRFVPEFRADRFTAPPSL
jgi:hypothetical protein